MSEDKQNPLKKQGGKRRLRGVLEVRVDARIRRDAERLAADEANGSLEEVLAGLVEDMAEAWERPESWEAAAVCGWMSSHPWRKGGEQ